MRGLIVFVLLIFCSFILVDQAQAKVLPQAAKAGKQTVVSKSTGTTISVSPRFRADRKAVIVNFSNLQNATSVSYVLIYTQNGQEEGAIGSLALGKSQTASQELLFGTCSKNVCRYHTNISNIKLEVTYTSKSGNKYIKRYKMKI